MRDVRGRGMLTFLFAHGLVVPFLVLLSLSVWGSRDEGVTVENGSTFGESSVRHSVQAIFWG